MVIELMLDRLHIGALLYDVQVHVSVNLKRSFKEGESCGCEQFTIAIAIL